MDPKFQTSFIPKKPMVEQDSAKSNISLFLLLSIIVFLVACGLSGFVFFQKKYLINQIATDKGLIEKNKNSFETGTIEQMIRLDSRIETATKILSNHISASPVFDFLEKTTLKNIRFKSFRFSISNKSSPTASDGSGIKIEMTGVARDFKTIALQADEFGKLIYRDYIKNPIFSGLNLTQDGSVAFNFSADVMSSFVNYKNMQSANNTTQQ